MTDPRLEALRATGAHQHDPARFHYLEVLARRLPGQPAAVQRLLAHKLDIAVTDYMHQVQHPVEQYPGRRPRRAESALAQLHRTLGTPRPANHADDPFAVDSMPLPRLKSVHQFGKVWSHIAAEQQVVQAVHRGPENAGPLNAHKLMLRSLSLMRSLSPAYLRHFMAHVDTLLWLDQEGRKASGSPVRAGRKVRRKP